MRQGEKGARFLGYVSEVGEAQGATYDVEKIAMFAGGGIGLMFNCT